MMSNVSALLRRSLQELTKEVDQHLIKIDHFVPAEHAQGAKT
jgi:hypothetical protein